MNKRIFGRAPCHGRKMSRALRRELEEDQILIVSSQTNPETITMSNVSSDTHNKDDDRYGTYNKIWLKWCHLSSSKACISLASWLFPQLAYQLNFISVLNCHEYKFSHQWPAINISESWLYLPVLFPLYQTIGERYHVGKEEKKPRKHLLVSLNFGMKI